MKKQENRILARTLFAAAAFTALMAAPSLHALPNYAEIGDAGQTLATAQNAGGQAGSTLTSITGTLSSAADADLFFFNVTNTTTFAATALGAVGSGGFPIDTSLFLFSANGSAVYANDDQSGTNYQAFLPSGNSLLTILAPGTYYLGISLSGNEPINSVSQMLFTTDLSTAVRGPATGLNPTAVSTFNGTPNFAETGTYTVTFAPVPEPSTYAMLAFGATASLGLFRRLRRQQGA